MMRVEPYPLGAPEADRLARARIADSARQLVADALVTPFLKEFRESLGDTGLFPPSDAEQRLGPVADAGVADAIVRRMPWSLVDQVERSLLERAGLSPKGVQA